MALILDQCPEASWIKTDMPGFERKGYRAIRIRRGSRVSYSDNKNNSTKAKLARWVSQYNTKNTRRANRMSKWGGFKGMGV